ncbi:MAG TPA: hypothetical protein DHV36_04420 [Desulfobacteraceae bacterium]|nr:hypothetical protein [Desulfobacteraceae bacterium]
MKRPGLNIFDPQGQGFVALPFVLGFQKGGVPDQQIAGDEQAKSRLPKAAYLTWFRTPPTINILFLRDLSRA